MTTKKMIFLVLGLLLLVGLYFLNKTLKIATGFTAKYVCSHHYIAKMPLEHVKNSTNYNFLKYTSFEIDEETQVVHSSIFGIFASQTAYYYEYGQNCGCSLVDRPKAREIKTNNNQFNPQLTWPIGDKVEMDSSSQVNRQALAKDIQTLMQKHSTAYALLIHHNNELIAEEYKEGIDKDMRLLGWSMTKSLLHTLMGILNKEKGFAPQRLNNIPEWQNDERKNIPIHDLLQMNSVLNWEEEYGGISDVTKMLYFSKSAVESAKTQKARKNGEKKWVYSSGTSNVLSGILRAEFDSQEAYLAFPHEKLFDKLGMQGATIETDASGNYIFSSYAWARARDWMRLGILYLNKGKWNGEEIFTEDWYKYCTQPVEGSLGQYGTQIWLNTEQELFKKVPKDAVILKGYGSQRIVVLPSQNMVITLICGYQPSLDMDEIYTDIIEKHFQAK